MNGTKIFLTAVAVALTAMLIAPAAQADENQHLNQVATSTATNGKLTRNQALALGNTACQAVRSAVANGMTLGQARAQADQAVDYTSQNMGLFLGEADGMFLVDAAVAQLC